MKQTKAVHDKITGKMFGHDLLSPYNLQNSNNMYDGRPKNVQYVPPYMDMQGDPGVPQYPPLLEPQVDHYYNGKKNFGYLGQVLGIFCSAKKSFPI